MRLSYIAIYFLINVLSIAVWLHELRAKAAKENRRVYFNNVYPDIYRLVIFGTVILFLSCIFSLIKFIKKTILHYFPKESDK